MKKVKLLIGCAILFDISIYSKAQSNYKVLSKINVLNDDGWKNQVADYF